MLKKVIDYNILKDDNDQKVLDGRTVRFIFDQFTIEVTGHADRVDVRKVSNHQNEQINVQPCCSNKIMIQ